MVRAKILKILILIMVAVWAAVWVSPDRNLHVVFCDVGQGDAILVMRGTAQMLIDTGTGKRVTDCLGRHMPFWDTRLEIMVVTHPDYDHAGGAVDVLKRLSVMQFVSPPVGAETTAFESLMRQISSRKPQVANVYAGDKMRLGEATAEVIWPERGWAGEHIGDGPASAEEAAGEGGAVLGAKAAGAETNDFSIGMVVTYGQFDVLLTGDGDGEIMEEQVKGGRLRDVEVAKVPHHGSKYAAVRQWFEKAKPELAVISVGKNSYGHPAGEVLDLLRELGVKVVRTDLEGDIEIVSDGQKWWVVKSILD